MCHRCVETHYCIRISKILTDRYRHVPATFSLGAHTDEEGVLHLELSTADGRLGIILIDGNARPSAYWTIVKSAWSDNLIHKHHRDLTGAVMGAVKGDIEDAH